MVKQNGSWIRSIELFWRYVEKMLTINKSPAEVLLGSRTCSVLDLMKRTTPESVQVNEAQNIQFNRKHVANIDRLKLEMQYKLNSTATNDIGSNELLLNRMVAWFFMIPLEDERPWGLIRSYVSYEDAHRTVNNLQLNSSAFANSIRRVQLSWSKPQVLKIFKQIVWIIPSHPYLNSDLQEVYVPSRDIMQVLQNIILESTEVTDQVQSRKRSLPFRGPSGRKQRLPSHFQYYEI